MMMSSINLIVVSAIAGLCFLDSPPFATAGSPHLTTDPPVTVPVTHPFPSWLEAFDTVKKEPTEPPQRDIVPLVVPDGRRKTWLQVRRNLSGQVWNLLNYIHTINTKYQPWQVIIPPVDYYPTMYPIPIPVWVDDEEYERYRRLNPLKEGEEDDNIRPLSMKAQHDEQQQNNQQGNDTDNEELITKESKEETVKILQLVNAEPPSKITSLRGAADNAAAT